VGVACRLNPQVLPSPARRRPGRMRGGGRRSVHVFASNTPPRSAGRGMGPLARAARRQGEGVGKDDRPDRTTGCGAECVDRGPETMTAREKLGFTRGSGSSHAVISRWTLTNEIITRGHLPRLHCCRRQRCGRVARRRGGRATSMAASPRRSTSLGDLLTAERASAHVAHRGEDGLER